MQLVHLFRILAAIILTTTLGLSAYLMLGEWRAYDTVAQVTPKLALLRTTLSAAEMVSAERGPTNAMLGASPAARGELARNLAAARERSNAAVTAAVELFEKLACAACGRNASRLQQTLRDLDITRNEIDRLADIAPGQRAPRELANAIASMFQSVQDVLAVADFVMFELVQTEPRIATQLSIARLAAELREYAGRTGSELTPALTARRPLDDDEQQRFWTERGRVLALGDLIRVRSADQGMLAPRAQHALEEMKRRYLGEGLSYVTEVASLPKAELPQPPIGTFVTVYVSQMRSIIELRDAELEMAQVVVDSRAAHARRVLWTLCGVVTLALLSTIVAVGTFARRVVSPLQQATRTVLRIANGEHVAPISVGARDQMGELMNALEHLRRAMVDKAELEIDRRDLIARLREAAAHDREQAELLIQARDAAEESSRAKDRFLAMMSHEIRTPMHGVLGLLELVQQGHLEAEQRRRIATANSSGKALLQILNDLLDFSKISAEKMTVSEATVDLRELLDDVAASMSANAHEKGLALSVKVDAAISALHVTDGMRLRQILLNLVTNAVKFTPAGSVKVAADLLESRNGREAIAFSVHDTGIGIGKEAQAGLFKPFAQVGELSTRQWGGTGLGLAISRQLATLLGGSLDFTSVEGEGSVFTLRVDLRVVTRQAPGHDATARQSDLSEPESSESIAKPQRILVAEDHPVNQFVLKSQLEQLGFVNVVICDDGEAAWSEYSASTVDLLITDLFMPRLDGIELSKRIRSFEPAGCKRTPIIALSASTSADDEARCRSAGVDIVLGKPLSSIDLRQAIDRLLQADA